MVALRKKTILFTLIFNDWHQESKGARDWLSGDLGSSLTCLNWFRCDLGGNSSASECCFFFTLWNESIGLWSLKSIAFQYSLMFCPRHWHCHCHSEALERTHRAICTKQEAAWARFTRQGWSGYDSVVNDLTIPLRPLGPGSFLSWFVKWDGGHRIISSACLWALWETGPILPLVYYFHRLKPTIQDTDFFPNLHAINISGNV